ncbi:MAG: citrate synthase I, partial [Bacteroidetes bacterium]|nr:citrate synthase I [Bacteroidota bacterium]
METKSVEQPKKKNGQGTVLETIKITDTRTGKAFEIPIQNDTIKAIDLRQIKAKDDDFGMMTYDPAFMNTASCKSKITFIDGDLGI